MLLENEELKVVKFANLTKIMYVGIIL